MNRSDYYIQQIRFGVFKESEPPRYRMVIQCLLAIIFFMGIVTTITVTVLALTQLEDASSKQLPATIPKNVYTISKSRVIKSTSKSNGNQSNSDSDTSTQQPPAMAPKNVYTISKSTMSTSIKPSNIKDSTAGSSDIPTQPDITSEDSRTKTSLPEYIQDLSFSKSNYSVYFGEENPFLTCVVIVKPEYPNLTVHIENENGLIGQFKFRYGVTNVYKSSVRFDVIRAGNDVYFELEMLNYTCSDKGIYTCSASYPGYQNISVDIELFIQVRPRLKLPTYLIDGEESTEFSCTVEEDSSVSWSIQFKNGTLISPFEVNQNMMANSDDVYCNLKSATFNRTFTVSMNDTTLCCNSRYGKQVDQACSKLYVLEKTYCKDEIFSYKSFPYDCFFAVFCFNGDIVITNPCEHKNMCFDEDSSGCNRALPNGTGNPYSCISKPDNYYIPMEGKCTEYNLCTGQIPFQHNCPSGQYFTNDQNKPCSTDMSKSCF